MAQIKPFQAITYNQQKIPDLSSVVCPPYDVISPERQEYLHALSRYNIIRLLLGKDVPGEDKYERSAALFEQWLREGILVRDTSPAVYFYSQQYTLRGEAKARFGFIALLKLEKAQGSVFGHEHTRQEPKEDRFKLLCKAKANLSPIFVVMPDHRRMIQRLHERYASTLEPFISLIDDEKTRHELWRLEDPRIASEIAASMGQESAFIADGHHRFEVACAYRDECASRGLLPTGEEPANYIMAYFTNPDPRGLTILPIHRLVHCPKGTDSARFMQALTEHFDVEQVKDQARFSFLMEKAGGNEHVLGMYGGKKYWLLRLKNVKMVDKLIADKPAEYRTLDVVILNSLVLERLLGVRAADSADVEFIHDAEELTRRADLDDSCIAFLLNPVRIQQVMAVALRGARMPPKSTFFYPKVLSGLTINMLDNGTLR